MRHDSAASEPLRSATACHPVPSSASAPRSSAPSGACGTSRPRCCRPTTSTRSAAPAGMALLLAPDPALIERARRGARPGRRADARRRRRHRPGQLRRRAGSRDRRPGARARRVRAGAHAARGRARDPGAGDLPRHAAAERRLRRHAAPAPARALRPPRPPGRPARSTAPTTTCASMPGSLAARAAGEELHAHEVAPPPGRRSRRRGARGDRRRDDRRPAGGAGAARRASSCSACSGTRRRTSAAA